MKIIFVSDHAGYALKEELKRILAPLARTIEDFGVFTADVPADEYPLLAAKAGEKVAKKEFDRGIFICGTGIGMSIAANKVPGVRAALCNDLYSAKKSREHNDANVCCLGARIVGSDLAKEIVRTWVETEFAGGRHSVRVAKYGEIEKTYCK
jgi:ribose 5-phosphate isomerase B